MTDVVVIGAGIAGLSVAARLAQHASVTVLEGEAAPGYHSSGRSAALFEENYGTPATKALAQISRNVYETGGYLTPRGLMLVCRASEEAAFEADLTDLGCMEISLADARKHVPLLHADVSRAAIQPDARDIDTDKVLQDLLKQVRALGGEVVFKAQVEQITRQDDLWRLQAGQTQYAARKIINAAGAWADKIADMAGVPTMGLQPHRRSVARVPAPAGVDVRQWPMVLGAGETWYAKPDAGALLISPADEDPIDAQDAWADDLVLAEGIDRYQAHVDHEIDRMLSNWAGLRTIAPDRHPVLGPDPQYPDFIWCAGQGGVGFITAFGASQLVADLTLGRTPPLSADHLSALTPERLR